MTKETLGARLIALKNRSGRSITSIAKDAGYKSRSGVQEFFTAAYDAPYLGVPIARKLAVALVGHGDPAITQDEVMALAGVTPAAEMPLILSDEVLIPVLEAFVAHAPSKELMTAGLPRSLAQAVRDILRLVSTHPAMSANPGEIDGAVRYAIAQALGSRPSA